MDNEMDMRLDELLHALLALETPEEARMFLRDLLTEKELSEFSKRWQAAQMLSEAVPYSQIVQTTGLSSTTIARISHWLAQGTGGYQLMLERVKQQGRELPAASSTLAANKLHRHLKS